ncbi:hypothetical protein [Actinoallomurus sp. CA-142502]|uniref:hypothetical protein n=1 Tax=Actinoallomurus sp. CA-142502 TaxID=3239885 RepID=UPI003D92C12D
MSEHPPGARAEWHDVLLRLAGWLADDDLTRAREFLAAGRLDELAGLIAGAVDTGLVPYSPGDAERLRRLLTGYVDDPSVVDAGIRRQMEQPPGDFAPVPPWGIGPSVVDEIDQAAVDAARKTTVSGLRRVWRYPPTGLQSPRRVYLAETPAGADPVEVTGLLQQALAEAGEAAPQVEAYSAGTPLPDYHRAALAGAEALPI